MTEFKPTPLKHGNWEVINGELIDVPVIPESPAEPDTINLVHDQSVEEE